MSCLWKLPTSCLRVTQVNLAVIGKEVIDQILNHASYFFVCGSRAGWEELLHTIDTPQGWLPHGEGRHVHIATASSGIPYVFAGRFTFLTQSILSQYTTCDGLGARFDVS